jgi:hypothetical protein
MTPAQRKRLMIPLSPGTRPAIAPIDSHAAAALAAFDELPDRIRKFMKTSRRQYKSLAIEKLVNEAGEDIALATLKKTDQPSPLRATARQSRRRI